MNDEQIAQLSDEQLAQRMALLDLIEIVENDGRDGSTELDIEQFSKNLDEELRRRTAELLADTAFSHDAAIEVMKRMETDGLDEWDGPSTREHAACMTNQQLRQRLDEELGKSEPR